MGRDHAIECDICGILTGGINDYHCLCDDDPSVQLWKELVFNDTVQMLADNLVYAAMLTKAYDTGRADEKLDVVVPHSGPPLKCACMECCFQER